MHKKKVSFNPMTLEGCVVKLADVISYSGRDLEDAIRLNFIKREDIPKNITNVLGNTNKDIVNTLILDVINNSKGHNYIKLSDDVFQALKDLVSFNYEHIYNKANSKEQIDYYDLMFNTLYYNYLESLEKKDLNSSIYTNFLDSMDNEYKKTNPKRIVIDYISLMTDTYFLNEFKKISEEKKGS
jgi:dGTPase